MMLCICSIPSNSREYYIYKKIVNFKLKCLCDVSGGVTSMDDFLKEFFPKVYRRKQMHLHETDYCKYDDQVLTLFTSSLYFSALVMTFFASFLTRKKGRKASIIVGALSFLAGAILNAAAKNIAMLIIGRVLLGGGIGFGNQVSAEILQNHYKTHFSH